MNQKINTSQIVSWILGMVVFAIGISNLFLVHPVPGIVFILLSLIYLPQANDLFRKKFGSPIPLVVKIILGILVIWFTLGVSDLGEIIDNQLIKSSSV